VIVPRLGSSTTAWRRRVAARPRLAILLAAVVISGVIAAGSLAVPHHDGRVADRGSAPPISPRLDGASDGLPGRAPSQPAASSQPAPSPDSSVSSDRAPSPDAVKQRNPLGAAAQAYVASRSGTVLAAVYDQKTGQTWTLGHAAPQDEASIVKVDILETLLAQHRANGTALSASDVTLAREMIEDSDNDAASVLWQEVGGAYGISTYNRSVGLTGTTPSSCITCPGFAWPGWGLSRTTPADQIALLRELFGARGRLTRAQQEFALGLMEGVTPSQRWGVADGVAQSATVALKNGWLPLTSAGNDWQINSIGWVSGTGRNYLIAVLTTGNPTKQYGIDTIGELSTIVWDQLR
jgi:hypothetical protein